MLGFTGGLVGVALWFLLRKNEESLLQLIAQIGGLWGGISVLIATAAFFRGDTQNTRAIVIEPTTTRIVQYANIETSIDLCESARNSVGEYITCKVENAFCSYEPTANGKPTFCNDSPYPHNNFTLVVWDQNWSDFDRQCILVTGRVSMYEGKPQIEAVSRSQIVLCEN